MWRVLGRSVRGASHRRRNLPNQDCIGWAATPDGRLTLAVADGHGSSSCFRSGTGSQLAVQVALELLAEFAARLDFKQEYLDDIEDEVKNKLVSHWRDAVEDHLSRNPFNERELGILSERTIFVAYGSTLLAALVGDSQLLLLQIGDGDIVLVSSAGRVTRPWPRDERLLGVETTSLCTEDAARNVRLRVEPLSSGSPRLILLCTDGYANSFQADAGFLKVGGDLLETIEEEGLDAVERDLEGWLEEASNLGSGDDVTVGILFREEPENGE